MSEHRMGPRETKLRLYYKGDEEALARSDVKDELRIARLEDHLEESIALYYAAIAAWKEDAPNLFAEQQAHINRLRAVLAEAT